MGNSVTFTSGSSSMAVNKGEPDPVTGAVYLEGFAIAKIGTAMAAQDKRLRDVLVEMAADTEKVAEWNESLEQIGNWTTAPPTALTMGSLLKQWGIDVGPNANRITGTALNTDGSTFTVHDNWPVPAAPADWNSPPAPGGIYEDTDGSLIFMFRNPSNNTIRTWDVTEVTVYVDPPTDEDFSFWERGIQREIDEASRLTQSKQMYMQQVTAQRGELRDLLSQIINIFQNIKLAIARTY